MNTEKSQLVKDVMVFIRQYAVMSREQLIVVALWIIHTHCIESVEVTPYLAVTSPEPRCGKSRLLELIAMLSADSWQVILPSEAVVYRKISRDTPTLLLDEVDAIFNVRTADRHEGLRALLNDGYRRGAKVPRCIGNTGDLVEFETFCAKVLAGIGTLPDTVADRSIPVRLERKTKADKTRRFRFEAVSSQAEPLRERVERWAGEHTEALAQAEPELPYELNDRAQDVCEVLLSIADLSGCGRSARAALVGLFDGERLDDQESMRVRLLRDIQAVFDRRKRRSLFTRTLLAELVAIEEAPWGSYYGRDIEARDLSTLLSHYGIKPTTVREGGTIAKGYKRDDLHDAWERYL